MKILNSLFLVTSLLFLLATHAQSQNTCPQNETYSTTTVMRMSCWILPNKLQHP